MKYLAMFALLFASASVSADPVDISAQEGIDEATEAIGATLSRGPDNTVTCKSGRVYKMVVSNTCSDGTATWNTSVFVISKSNVITISHLVTDEAVCGLAPEEPFIGQFLSTKDYREAKRAVARLCRETLRLQK